MDWRHDSSSSLSLVLPRTSVHANTRTCLRRQDSVTSMQTVSTLICWNKKAKQKFLKFLNRLNQFSYIDLHLHLRCLCRAHGILPEWQEPVSRQRSWRKRGWWASMQRSWHFSEPTSDLRSLLADSFSTTQGPCHEALSFPPRHPRDPRPAPWGRLCRPA